MFLNVLSIVTENVSSAGHNESQPHKIGAGTQNDGLLSQRPFPLPAQGCYRDREGRVFFSYPIIFLAFGRLQPCPFIFLAFDLLSVRTRPLHLLAQLRRLPRISVGLQQQRGAARALSNHPSSF